jgi:cobaltochelatase CobN
LLATVVVCDSCCCGNDKKDHNIVPIDFLNKSWEKYKLGNEVNLRISTCLGPCNMHNVSLLKTENENIWVGNLGTEEHYESIIEWAIQTSRSDQNVELSSILLSKVFDYDGDADGIIS